jgi:amidophosphoribosyltransferase
MAVRNPKGFTRFIHDISNAQFRSKFDPDLGLMRGTMGIGVISDYEDQPLLISSHLGTYAIVTVGVVRNIGSLSERAFRTRRVHFSEMSGGEINPTEIVATLINEEATLADGLRRAQEAVEGSCSILLLTDHGVYAARDLLGRTPVVLGGKDGAQAVAMETTAFPNLEYATTRFLGPGEVVRLTPEGVETLKPALDRLQVCAFLWVYYGYPSSDYEGINVEAARYRCGEALAVQDAVELDLVSGIPDSGTAHALGYAHAKGIPYRRPFVKYTPTWPRSFMPQDQSIRELVARMKLIPIRSLIEGQRMLFCEDSIVRGTQLGDIIQRLYHYGAREVHMRPACPPLVFGCRFLNFSRSRSELDLAARRAIQEIESQEGTDLKPYANPSSAQHVDMVGRIGKRLKLTSLKYQRLDDLVGAIGLPKCRLCTYCWDGVE